MTKIFDFKDKINEEELKEVSFVIKENGLVIFPTETVYGLGANALNEEAVSKIFIAKGRPNDNPLIVHISNFDMLNELTKNITDIEKKLIDAFFPGPFTLILEKSDLVPNNVTCNLNTVGIRMPSNKIANRLIELSGPIAAPSANISGRPSGTKASDIIEEFNDKVDINRIETLPSPHSSIYNHTNSEITVNSMHLNGGELHNHCLVKVGTFSFDGSASGLYLNRGSSVISGNFIYGYDTKISMAEHSLFETDALNPAQTGPVSLVVEDADANQYGDGNSAKLFKVNGVLDYTSVQITGFFWSDLYTYAQSEVNYSANKNGALRVVGNKCPVNISGDCFGDINYSKDEPFTDESETPEYKPEYDKTEAYVYLFEDNWPNFGDYDMNDLVMIVSIMNTTEASSEGINAKTVYLSTSVRAVGATKSLYAFAKIQGTDKVINLLEGKEAHEFMNSEPGQIINTYNKTCEARESLIEVDVNGMSGVVNANNLNVFIVWGDPNKNKKNEVHIAGFLGTEQAATALTSDEYYRYKYNENIDNSTEEFNNMMWGLMIPKSSFDSYPREGISIMDAYPQFMNWAKSGGKDVLDWYTLGVNDLLYQGDSAKDK